MPSNYPANYKLFWYTHWSIFKVFRRLHVLVLIVLALQVYKNIGACITKCIRKTDDLKRNPDDHCQLDFWSWVIYEMESCFNQFAGTSVINWALWLLSLECVCIWPKDAKKYQPRWKSNCFTPGQGIHLPSDVRAWDECSNQTVMPATLRELRTLL